ncbi:hypothetical protein MB84_28555 (plasmid) [Pandoraea oxalativorans]|uniref:Uncharacterized protein n=1 Tax=Pandoraea oxalativorans TaxID=573737 RepID=A0A0G3IFS7_9BURK|nr:hypothetical protein MB84_28555 [Pandoraea oxalativorans]
MPASIGRTPEKQSVADDGPLPSSGAAAVSRRLIPMLGGMPAWPCTIGRPRCAGDVDTAGAPPKGVEDRRPGGVGLAARGVLSQPVSRRRITPAPPQATETTGGAFSTGGV